jgi:hypothetical protein
MGAVLIAGLAAWLAIVALLLDNERAAMLAALSSVLTLAWLAAGDGP